ncbi:MAG: DUF2608 domain-containing protein [Alphaproteobacteria bacterium]|nr:DUF2608 domain-containing protein [Alphaproteobacteria bacterium]
MFDIGKLINFCDIHHKCFFIIKNYLFLLWAKSERSIIKALSFDQIEEIISHVIKGRDPAGILAIWDIDFVLLQPTEPAFAASAVQSYMISLVWLFGSLAPEKIDFVVARAITSSASELMEKKSSLIFNKIKETRINMIGATAILLGANHPGSIKKWRLEELKKHGICFESNLFSCDEQHQGELKPFYSHAPCFEEGILFSNGEYGPHLKGEVLRHFFKKATSLKTVIAIDDNILMLKNIKKISENWTKI